MLHMPGTMRSTCLLLDTRGVTGPRGLPGSAFAWIQKTLNCAANPAWFLSARALQAGTVHEQVGLLPVIPPGQDQLREACRIPHLFIDPRLQ